MDVTFALGGGQHAELMRHLYPGDGHEGVALALCGRGRACGAERLVARLIVPLPHEAVAHRGPDEIEWSVQDHVLPLVETMERDDLALVVVHCHPGGYPHFSGADDEADRLLFPSVHSWFDHPGAHGAAVMLPDGSVFGRAVAPDGSFAPFRRISVAGDDLHFYPLRSGDAAVPAAAKRVAQTFGAGTYSLLRGLRVAVVGCSGTGSIVAELLARDCVGGLLLVDNDVVEPGNLTRILNARLSDAQAGAAKVDVLAAAIREFGLGTEVETVRGSVLDEAVARRVARCDVAFGCMDTAEGRHVLGQLCSAYAIPLFDVGVHIEPDGAGGITHAVAAAHYVQPGGSSLLSRGVYSGEDLDSESSRRAAPDDYARRVAAGYLRAVDEDRPAVMPLNMMAANLSVLDFLARIHRFRLDPNGVFARQAMSLTHGYYEQGGDGDPCKAMMRHLGAGDFWHPPC
ncbi:MAG: ThiF family adenylyltransferase [Acetobacteraceae bacterium]|nr:ThiF family adenylyltransferase [Acetobacteraceae bacterium]